MYYDFFGLKRPPFKITPDTAFFFEGGNRGAVLEALLYAIAQGEGIIKVTGEVGSGKTMLCRVLLHRLDQTVDVVYLANPSVAPNEILHAIAFELSLKIPREASRVEVLHTLQNYLVSRHAKGHQVVLFVEESQRMPLETLEEIRLLSNLETSDHKLLQIVLFGQPELDENLKQPHIRQLRERITYSFDLGPLKHDEIAQYLSFRLRAAGYRGPALFSKAVVDVIAEASKGLTRRVNIIADKAMLAAFTENTHTLGVKHVRSAIADSEFSRGESNRSSGVLPMSGKWLVAGGAALAVLGIVGWLLWTARPATVTSLVNEPAASPSPSGSIAQEPMARPMPAGYVPSAASPAAPVAGPNVEPIAPARSPAEATIPLSSQNASIASAPAASDFVATRIVESVAWLKAQNPDAFSIQILTGADEEYLKSYFRNLPKSVERDRFFVYRTSADARPLYTVVFGSFAGQREANEALWTLPPELTRFRPYARSFRVIRSEVEAASVAGLE